MSKKINIVIIGAGNIAIEHLKVLREIKEVNIYAICSRTKKKVNDLAVRFKINQTSTNTNEFIKKNINNIDGIMVLVSSDQMYKVAKKVLSFGKPVFLEKPPGLKFKEIKNLEIIAKREKSLNMIGFNRRYYSIFQKAKDDIIKNDKILSIIIEGNERYNLIKDIINKKILKNWLFANSSHTVDLLRFFCGEIETLKFVKQSNKIKNGDQFSCAIKFKNGSIGTYFSSWLSPGSWSIKIFLENKIIIFNPLEKGYVIGNNFKKKIILPNKYDKKFKFGFYKQTKAFIDIIKKNKVNYPSQDLTSTLKTFKILEKLNV